MGIHKALPFIRVDINHAADSAVPGQIKWFGKQAGLCSQILQYADGSRIIQGQLTMSRLLPARIIHFHYFVHFPLFHIRSRAIFHFCFPSRPLACTSCR